MGAMRREHMPVEPEPTEWDGVDRQTPGYRHRAQHATTVDRMPTAPFDQAQSSKHPADLDSQHDMHVRVQGSVAGCDSAFIHPRRSATVNSEIGTGSAQVAGIRYGRGRGLASLFGDGDG